MTNSSVKARSIRSAFEDEPKKLVGVQPAPMITLQNPDEGEATQMRESESVSKGRKRFSGAEQSRSGSTQISCFIPSELYEAMRFYCFKARVSHTRLIIDAVTEYLRLGEQ